MQSQICLVLLAHGSRDARWREPFESLAQTLAAEMESIQVRLAYLELCPPTLAEVVMQWPDDSLVQIRILPLFLAHGAHVRRDIQNQIDALEHRRQQIVLELFPPAGDDPRVFALLREIAREVSQR